MVNKGCPNQLRLGILVQYHLHLEMDKRWVIQWLKLIICFFFAYTCNGQKKYRDIFDDDVL